MQKCAFLAKPLPGILQATRHLAAGLLPHSRGVLRVLVVSTGAQLAVSPVEVMQALKGVADRLGDRHVAHQATNDGAGHAEHESAGQRTEAGGHGFYTCREFVAALRLAHGERSHRGIEDQRALEAHLPARLGGLLQAVVERLASQLRVAERGPGLPERRDYTRAPVAQCCCRISCKPRPCHQTPLSNRSLKAALAVASPCSCTPHSHSSINL